MVSPTTTDEYDPTIDEEDAAEGTTVCPLLAKGVERVRKVVVGGAAKKEGVVSEWWRMVLGGAAKSGAASGA
jgi:hypothetical protein